MRPLSVKKLMDVLREHDFVVSRQRGSHIIFKNSKSGIIVPVPLHGKTKPIPIGTFLSIVKQSKIPKDKFR